MNVARIEICKDVIRLTAIDDDGNPEDSFTEIPIRLILNLMDSPFQDFEAVIREFYHFEGEFGELAEVHEFVKVTDARHIFFMDHLHPNSVMFRFGHGEEGPEMGTYLFAILASSEELCFDSRDSSFTKPDILQFFYEEQNLEPVLLAKDGNIESRMIFNNLNVKGYFNPGPCQFQTYEEAVEMVGLSVTMRLLNVFNSFRPKVGQT